MKFFNILSVFLVFCAMQSLAYSKAIDMEGRTIPFQINASNVLSGMLDTRFVPGGTSIQVQPELTSETARLIYGLLVPGKSDTKVTVNGKRIELLPASRLDGDVYLIDPLFLVDGTNSIRIDRQAAQPWTGLAMFSVSSTSEQVHFDEYFGEYPEATEDGKSTREVPPSSLQTNYDVQWYDCTWKPTVGLNSTEYMESGSQVIMGAKSLVPGLQVIQIDFDMNPNNNGGPGMVIDYLDSGAGTSALAYSYINDNINPRLEITLPTPKNTGEEFQVRIGYHGTPNNVGHKEIFGRDAFYSINHSNDSRPVVYTVSQPYGGRRWWPSKDHPSDKATTTVQKIIVPKPAGYTLTAVSNGKLINTVDQGSTLMYVWDNEYPIPTYLMSMCISNYVYRGGTYTALDNQTTMPVGHYIYPQDESTDGNAYLGTIQLMNFFADRFGEYPFISQKYVTATWGISWAIEHQTATSMPNGANGLNGNGLTRRNVHELAHQWFGDKVTMADWDHLWLNEGFATYCEPLWDEHVDGISAYHAQFETWRNSSADGSNGISTTLPVVGSTADNFAGNLAYRKGALVLHMLRNYLGDEGFFEGCRNYLNRGYRSALSQPSPGSVDDLQTAMEAGAGLTTGSLQSFFDQWLYSPNSNYRHRPTYSFSAPYNPANQTVTISINQHQGLNNFVMPVDIVFTDAGSNKMTVRVPAGSNSLSYNMGSFVPLTAQFDPDKWIWRSLRANITTSRLPAGTSNASYSASLSRTGDGGSYSWLKVNGASWINVSAGGAISGIPAAAGVYPLTVRLSNVSDSVTYTQEATFQIIVENAVPPPNIVINEVLYENSTDGTDTNEFVELYNKEATAVNISGWQLVVVGSNGAASLTVTIPASTVLSANDYYVIGNSSVINPVFGSVVDQDAGWSESLPDGNPGGLVLKSATGARVDSVTWRSDAAYGAGSEGASARAEGGTGRAISFSMAETNKNVTLGRLPNGKDTQSNLLDFALIPPSPGSANAGITLPFEDNFNSGAKPEWKPSFQDPVRTVTPGSAGKPITASPDGGGVLEVYDATGGGDVNYVSGAFDQLNVEGYLWIPAANNAPWSIGIGAGTRVESAWFSSTPGFALEHGLYLEYQNGTGMGIKNGRVTNSPNQARLIAGNSINAPGLGIAGYTSLYPGTAVSLSADSWQPFRLFYSTPLNRVFARIGGNIIYDGPMPAGLENLSGGVCIGFREEHSGNPLSVNREGTFVDAIQINNTAPPTSSITDYFLY